jgi:hypothetical protein
VTRLWWLWLSLVVWASDDDLLAPRVDAVDSHIGRTTRLLDEADVHQEALGKAQSLFVLEGCVSGRCPTERAILLIVQTERAGHASRDLLQSARMALQRAHRAASSPMVRPLVSAERLDELDALDARVERAVRAWSIRASWYSAVMDGWAWHHRHGIEKVCELQDADP